MDRTPWCAECRVWRTCFLSLTGITVLSSSMGTLSTSLSLSLTLQYCLIYPGRQSGGPTQPPLIQSERSLNSPSSTNSDLTMSQLTDLTPSSMDASMHPDTSIAGSGMVNSAPIVILTVPNTPSQAEETSSITSIMETSL